MVDCCQQNYFFQVIRFGDLKIFSLPPKLPASLEFFQIFLSPRCHLPTYPFFNLPDPTCADFKPTPRTPDLPPTRRQPHNEASPSAASSARRRLPFSSLAAPVDGGLEPRRCPLSSPTGSRARSDIVLTDTKPHPRGSHLSPEAPRRVSSLHRPASIARLQPASSASAM